MAQASVSVKLTPGEFRTLADAVRIAYRVYDLIDHREIHQEVQFVVDMPENTLEIPGRKSDLKALYRSAGLGTDIK